MDSNVLSLAIKDKTVLYVAYMSFIANGGLFIPTQRKFDWNQPVSLMLHIMEDPEKYPVQAKVIWMTPKGAQGNRAAGIGVQFQGEEGRKLKNKIETYIAGMIDSDRPTHTL